MTHPAVQVIDLPVPQQRIIAILGKAMAQPALVMVDEPTAHLKDGCGVDQPCTQDAGAQDAFVGGLAPSGTNTELADRVILMANGVVQEDAATEFFTNLEARQLAASCAPGPARRSVLVRWTMWWRICRRVPRRRLRP
jgi:ABC-type arginine transport system ATPase subunit